MDAGIHTEGLREFRRDLRKFAPEVDRVLRADINIAAGRVLIEARGDAPMRTGALARSLKKSVTVRGASIYSTLPYAGVVHWGGTITPRGVPIVFERTEYITKAVERHADTIEEDIANGVQRAALRAGWR